MGFFDIFKSPFSVLSELEAKKKELEEKEKREEEEKKKEFRERLGRPSTTGLLGASARTADEWLKAKTGNTKPSIFLWADKLIEQTLKTNDGKEKFNSYWKGLDLADKVNYLKNFHVEDTSGLSNYEKALNNYYSPYKGVDGRTFDLLNDKEKDALFRDLLFDIEVGKIYDRIKTPDGKYHYDALPERLKLLEKERLQKLGLYEDVSVDAANQKSYKEFSGTDIFPYLDLEGKERDRILRDIMLERTFKNHPLYDNIKLLHPQVRQKLYDNPEVLNNQSGLMIKDADLEEQIESYYHPILGKYRLLRGKLARSIDKMNQSAGSDPHGLWHTFLTGEGNEGLKAMVGLLTLVATRGMGIKGLPAAGVMTAANMDWNKIITDVTGNDEANILREADSESVQKVNESIAEYLPQAKNILNNTQLDTDNNNNKNEIDSLWDDLTSENNLWKTFGYKEEAQAYFNLSKKKDLITETLLVSDMYGQPQALKYFNDKLNDEISELLDSGPKSFKRMQKAIATKAVASFAQGILSTELLWQGGKLIVGAITGDDELVQEGGQAINNLPLGLKADGTRAPFLLNLKYWDGVDKMNVWDPDYIDNINYGIYEPDGKHPTKEFSKYLQENKGKYKGKNLDEDEIIDKIKEDYILEQEQIGIYNGTGISEYVRIPKTGEEHTIFSMNTLEFGTGMMGYIYGQNALRRTTLGIGKGMNAIGRGLGYVGNSISNSRAGIAMQTAGAKFGQILKPLTSKMSISPAKNLLIKNFFRDFGKDFHDTLDANLTSASISFGYGFGAMDDIQRSGLESLRQGIQQRMETEDLRIQSESNLNGYAEMWGNPNSQNQEEVGFSQRYRQFRSLIDSYSNSVQANFLNELLLKMSENPNFTEEDAKKLWRSYAEELNRTISTAREEFIDKELRQHHKEDLVDLRNNSIKGFYTQAAIEQYRMATFMPKYNRMVFRDVAQRMGRLANRLPLENVFKNLYRGKLASTVVNRTTGAIERNTGRLRNFAEKTTNVLRQVWAGAYSNYMDDVTSAYTKGYYINDYNNYLAHKYDSDAWGYEASNLSNFIAGVNSALDMMTDPQALYDAFIGGIGTSLPGVPYGAFNLATHVIGKASFKKGWNSFTTEKDTGRKLTPIEIWGKLFNNGVLNAIGEVNAANYYRDKKLDAISKAGKILIQTTELELKERGIPTIFSSALLTSWAEQIDDIQSEIIDVLDGKEGLGFSLSQLIHDSIEELGENESSNPYAALLHNIQRLAKGNYKSQSNMPYEQYSEEGTGKTSSRASRWATNLAIALSNYANRSENPNSTKKDGIREEDVDAYMQDPVNAERISKEKDRLEEEFEKQDTETDRDTFIDNGLRLYAADRIQKNAEKFLNFYKSFHNNLKTTRQYFGMSDSNDRDAALQMAYNLTMYERWKKRLQSLNKKIENSEEWNLNRSSIVQFRNIGYINRKINNLEREIKTAQTKRDKYAKMKDSLHKVRKHGNEEDAYNVMQELFAMTGELSKEDLLLFKRQWQEAVKGDNPSINRFSVIRDAERRMEILKRSYDNIISYNKTLHEQALTHKKETLKDIDPALVKEAEEAYEKLSKLKKPEIKLELESTPKSRKFLREMEKRHPQDKATKEEEQESQENQEGQENLEKSTEETQKETPITGLEKIKNKKEADKQVQELVQYEKEYSKLNRKVHENTPVITAEEIVHLNPADRATLILERKEYSRQQQEEIDKYLELVENEGRMATFFNSENYYNVEDVLDAGILYERLQSTDKLLKEMIKSPAVYAHYSRLVAKNLLTAQLLRYMLSPEFQQHMLIISTISTIVGAIPTIKGSNPINNQNIVNTILNTLSKYKEEIKDWESPTLLLKAYDEHVNEIMEALDLNENITREAIAGKGLLPMQSEANEGNGINSIRDIFERTLDNYLKDQQDKKERNNPENAPDRESTYTEQLLRQDELNNSEEAVTSEETNTTEEEASEEETVEQITEEIILEDEALTPPERINNTIDDLLSPEELAAKEKAAKEEAERQQELNNKAVLTYTEELKSTSEDIVEEHKNQARQAADAMLEVLRDENASIIDKINAFSAYKNHEVRIKIEGVKDDVLTQEEEQELQAFLDKALAEGYSYDNSMPMSYSLNANTTAEFREDIDLPEGSQIISWWKKPIIFKDGKVIQNGEPIVLQGTKVIQQETPNNTIEGEESADPIQELYDANEVIETGDGVYIPLAKGVKIQFPDNIGGHVIEIQEVLKDNGHTVLRVVRTDRGGETVEEERPAGTLADTNNLKIFAPDGAEITNYMKSQADSNQSPVDNTTEAPASPIENKNERKPEESESNENKVSILGREAENKAERVKRANLLHKDEVEDVYSGNDSTVLTLRLKNGKVIYYNTYLGKGEYDNKWSGYKITYEEITDEEAKEIAKKYLPAELISFLESGEALKEYLAIIKAWNDASDVSHKSQGDLSWGEYISRAVSSLKSRLRDEFGIYYIENDNTLLIHNDPSLLNTEGNNKKVETGKTNVQSEEGSQEGEVNKGTSEEQIINNWINDPQVVETIKQYCVGVSSVEEAVQKMLLDTENPALKDSLNNILKYESSRKIIEQLIQECNKTKSPSNTEGVPPQSPKSKDSKYNEKRDEAEGDVGNIINNAKGKAKESILKAYVEKAKSAIISLLNPFRWRKSGKGTSARSIYDQWIRYVGEPHAAMRKLGEISRMKASDRPYVYFYVPKKWHESLLSSKDLNTYTPEDDLPIIMVVEDTDGQIIIKNPNGKEVRYTAIGLAPSGAGKINTDIPIESYPYGTEHWHTPRQLGLKALALMKEGDLGGLIKNDSGDAIKASINNIRFITPQSVPLGSKKSVQDIALDYLHYNGDSSVFSVEEILNQEGGFFENFMMNFLRNLKIVTRNKGNKNESRELVYQVADSNNPLIVSHWDLHELSVKVNGEVKNIREALDIAVEDSYAAESLFRNSYYFNRIYKIISDSFSRAATVDNVFILAAGEKNFSLEFRNKLNNELKNLKYYLYTQKGNEFSFTANLITKQINGETRQFLKLGIKQGDSINYVEVGITKDEKPLITNITGALIIKNLLYEGNEGRGEERKVNITLPYENIEKYKDIIEGKSNLETAQQWAIRNDLEALFKEGIFTLFHDDFKQFDVSIAFDSELMNQAELNPQPNITTVSESDNATSNQPVVPELPLPPLPPKKQNVYDLVMDKVKQIVQNSKKRFEVWKARHAGNARSLSQSFSATSVASAISGDYFAPNSPWALPSRFIGNTGDSFLRSFFKGTLKREDFLMLNDEAYNNMLKHLENFKSSLIAKGETYINTEETILLGNTNVTFNINGVQKTISLQGENHFDMFTVDTEGKIHIYDFKTFRDDGNFIDNIFAKYQVQLNTYRNALKQEYPDLEVASLHIVPIEVSYKSPDEASYSLDAENNLLQDGEKLVLDANSFKAGMRVNVRIYISEYATSITSERKLFIESLLKGLGFNSQLLEFIKDKKMNSRRLKGNDIKLKKEIEDKIQIITRVRTHSLLIPINENTDIDFNSLVSLAKDEIIRLATVQGIDLSDLGIKQDNLNLNGKESLNAGELVIQGKVESNKVSQEQIESDLIHKDNKNDDFEIVADDKAKDWTLEQKENLEDEIADCI